jgi:small subunit ribosomal protein S8
MNDKGYIGSFEEIKSKKGNKVKINLLSRINKCGVIKPRLAIKKDNYEKFEKRFLPAKNFGILLVSTTYGIITNEECKEKGIGGKLLGYCY